MIGGKKMELEDAFTALILIGITFIVYFWRKKKRKELIIAVVLSLGAFIGFGMTYEEEIETEDPDTEEITEEKEKNKEKNKVNSEEESKKEVNLDIINEKIANDIKKQKGWAMGTLNSDGEPIDNGEPDDFFEHALYINELTYDGSDLEMQINGDFLKLNDDDKNFVANQAQNTANSIIGEEENWKTEKYQKRLYLSIFNGKKLVGHSKISDLSEFKWNE